MTMRVLLVDDDIETTQLFQATLPRLAPTVELVVANNLEDAERLAMNQVFDVGVIDLRIPATAERPTEVADSHGMRAFRCFYENQPTSPVVLFTGFPSVPVSQQLLEDYNRPRYACFGQGSHALTRLITKDRAQQVIDYIVSCAAEIERVEDVELEVEGGARPLSAEDRRVLKVGALQFGATRARISVLSGGLSGARAVRYIAKNDNGQTRAIALAKISTEVDVDTEKRAFREHISAVLPEGTYASLIRKVVAAGSRSAALFYKLADSTSARLPTSLFAALSESPQFIRDLVGSLRDAEDRWVRDAPESRVSVGEIRRRLVADELESRQFQESLAEFRACETRRVLTRTSSQHLDLHGGNVLIRDGRPLLIDFGNVGQGPAGIDPVMLELSLVSHPDGRLVCREWPTIVDAENWPDVTLYTRNAPENIAAFVTACREWAHAAAGNGNVVLACAYAFALKQLKYDDVDHAFFRAVAHACYRRLLDT